MKTLITAAAILLNDVTIDQSDTGALIRAPGLAPGSSLVASSSLTIPPGTELRMDLNSAVLVACLTLQTAVPVSSASIHDCTGSGILAPAAASANYTGNQFSIKLCAGVRCSAACGGPSRTGASGLAFGSCNFRCSAITCTSSWRRATGARCHGGCRGYPFASLAPPMVRWGARGACSPSAITRVS